MPIFLDRHDMTGLTPEQIAEAHRMDLEIQDEYGVKFQTYWFDRERGTGYCLVEAPDIETAKLVHEKSHGNQALDVIPVDLSAVEAFLGRIADPAPLAPGGEPELDRAFRAIMFTDIVDSTAMTARLGDERSVEMVRAHDSIVRRALKDADGREIKHTGDGIMAAFDDADPGVRCARSIQAGFDAFNLASDEKLHVRIGLHAGEPVEDNNDLFGATVQMASRICDQAGADAIVISKTVRDLVTSVKELTELGAKTLKGFADPVTLYEVGWR
jgi:class 3 adenylate cyclase